MSGLWGEAYDRESDRLGRLVKTTWNYAQLSFRIGITAIDSQVTGFLLGRESRPTTTREAATARAASKSRGWLKLKIGVMVSGASRTRCDV